MIFSVLCARLLTSRLAFLRSANGAAGSWGIAVKFLPGSSQGALESAWITPVVKLVAIVSAASRAKIPTRQEAKALSSMELMSETIPSELQADPGELHQSQLRRLHQGLDQQPFNPGMRTGFANIVCVTVLGAQHLSLQTTDFTSTVVTVRRYVSLVTLEASSYGALKDTTSCLKVGRLLWYVTGRSVAVYLFIAPELGKVLSVMHLELHKFVFLTAWRHIP
jgi:hypothetical protein